MSSKVRCPLCRVNPAAAQVCGACERSYGPRVARLLARAEADPEFAHACFAFMPAAARPRFAELLSSRCLAPGSDSLRGPGLRSTRPPASAKWLAAAN